MQTPQQKTYTVAAAAKALNMSSSSIRSYSDTYAVHLSESANGRPRRFTADDLRLMAFAWDSVNNRNNTHEQTLDRLPSALESFTWSAPVDATDATPDATDSYTQQDTALVPAAALRAAQTMLQDRQDRIEQLENDLRTAQGRIEQLQHENGRLQGENTQLGRSWWKRLLGLRD